ncbi:MAG TPA: YIP1 family protein, partial [Myxococcaceae bacterium]|nr:YIP1 family protein [Myxococcaceae bacterium]
MASATEPLRALIDPIDGTRAAVEARRWVWPMAALALCASTAGVNFALHWNAEPVVVKELEKAGDMNTTTEQDLATKVKTTQRIALVGGIARGVLGMPLAIVLVAAGLKVLGWLT